MSQAERAFVTGYLCHLATDECWKQLGWQLFQELNISSWADFPVPGDVSLTAFDFLSAKLPLDPATARAALQAAAIPDVFKHIPHAMLVHQWEIIQDYVWNGGTPEAYVRMLAAAGEPIAEFQAAEQRHAIYWQDALELIHGIGGVVRFIQSAVARSASVIPQLWYARWAEHTA